MMKRFTLASFSITPKFRGIEGGIADALPSAQIVFNHESARIFTNGFEEVAQTLKRYSHF
jgi:hypothetical protein